MVLKIVWDAGQSMFQFPAGGVESAVEPGRFHGDADLGHGVTLNTRKMISVQAIGPPDGHSRRHGDAEEDARSHQFFSPNMSANRSLRARTASFASGP